MLKLEMLTNVPKRLILMIFKKVGSIPSEFNTMRTHFLLKYLNELIDPTFINIDLQIWQKWRRCIFSPLCVILLKYEKYSSVLKLFFIHLRFYQTKEYFPKPFLNFKNVKVTINPFEFLY